MSAGEKRTDGLEAMQSDVNAPSSRKGPSIMNRNIIAALIAGLSLAIVGCNKIGQSGAASQPQEDSKADASSADDAWSEKVQAYIKIGNRLRGFTSAANETFSVWRAEAAEKAKAGDFKEIRTDSHYFSDSDIKNIKDAAAMPGKIPELDKSADDLLAALNQHLANWNELQEYNKAKRYEDDAGAKGKAMLPMYLEGIAKIEHTVDTLQARIDAAAKVEHQKTVARFKAEGQLLEMHTWEAMGSAEKVVDQFADVEDFKDPAKIKQADANIAAMETSITAIKREYAKRKTEDAESLPTIDRYDSVISELNVLAGHYRESRKDPEKFNDAVSSYNEAIDALNMMNR
jgi:hypothetical protein